VHYTAKGYSLAAAGLESLVYEKRGEEKEAEASRGQGPSKKPRIDPTENRPSWVEGRVSEAVRRDTGGQARPPAFKSKWRGQQQGSGYGRRSSDRGHGSGYERGSSE
jgi:hypothetical protein